MTVPHGQTSDALVYICEFCFLVFGFSLLFVVGFRDSARSTFLNVMWLSVAGFVLSGAACLVTR
ncbi:hypothetical protein [Acetobacter oeni]|uniref:Uncharacterized protein n=1 Tax=Acetobacter oeni TaxID=304077 RepID=A0A511XQN1_9PROT|nr:hypothetical protein [Acetobacter oeni]MBB3884866.1 hypothetical protein [Acetobacter oeni]NHO20716.1 hypothetical protein [Acetobacter oeni]GEN65271.1 hypothetical protein AOE01nite_34950 [Acetobacter oeni]